MASAQRPPLNICLLLAIPAEAQDRPNRQTMFYGAKQSIKRCIDVVFWKLRIYHFYSHAWERKINTNKGDIAIRQNISRQLTDEFSDMTVKFNEIGWLDLDERTAIDIGRRHHLLIIAGSGYLRFDDHDALPPRLKRDAENLAWVACPKIAYGIGINKSLGKGSHDSQGQSSDLPEETEHFLRAIFQQLDAISVRDEMTRALVAKRTNIPVSLTGDPVLFADRTPNRPRPNGSARLKIGLNIALHEGQVMAELAGTLSICMTFLERLQKEQGAEIHYIQHCDIERVIPRLLSYRGLRVTAHDADGAALLDIYRSLDLHLCQMLHSSIMSCSVGTPVINIPYDVKNRSFFELMGLTEFLIAPQDLTAEKLWAVAQLALQSGPALSHRILSRVDQLRGSSDGFLGRVREVVETASCGASR